MGCRHFKYLHNNLLEIDFDPILVVCFEGLLENEHPYNFASRQCIKELLQTEVTSNLNKRERKIK